QPHPGRAVEEAHGGGFNLLYPKYNTNAGGNNGDIADLFGSKPSLKGVFDGTTNPNTNLYNSTAAVPVGGQNTASGISIFDIEPTPGGGDDAMNFTMGAALPVQLTSIDITNSSEVVITAAVPLTQGNSAGLSHIKSPTNANGTFQYAWSSSNTSVVTVTPTAGDSGMTATINSVTPGSADITLTVRQDLGSDGSVDITMTDTISVSVTNISHTGSNWYVKVGGSGDGSGNNWDNAAGDLSLVMHLADDGDNIYVAEGTYTPTRDVGGASPADVRNRTFSVEKSYTLSGGYPNTAAGTDRSVRDPWTYRTVLDGENVSYHVMRLFSVAVTVDVDGFTLTRGNAIGTSGRGGGVYIEGGYPSPGNSSSSTFRNCRFIDNISTGHGPAAMADGYGGSSGVNASFINCTFSGNFSSGERGTVMWDGDTYGVLSFENCTFFNNNSSSPEVDAVILTRTTTTVKNCTFVDNFWTAGASARYAIRREGGTVTVSNSLFVRSGITANTNGGLADGGYNIFGPNPGVSLNTTSLSLADSAVNVDPFGPAYNGGANETLALISGSPAINKISSGYPATDQRGVARPVGAGGDVGAFEFEGAAPVSPMTMNPKTIVALVGDRNLIFTVWPTDSGTTVPTSGTWSSSNSAVASVVSTTPSAAGYPRGRVSALTAGFSEITYTSGSMTASGRVEIIRTSGSPPVPIPESEPEPEPSPDFSGLPIERISDADSTLIAGGETLDLVYPEPTDVTVSENPSEGFEPADDELVVRGESRMFEITYDASNIKDEDAAKIPALAIELSLSTDIDNAEYAADIEEFFSKYGVFKQISGQVFDLARIVNDSGIPLRDVFSVSMSEHSLPCVEVTARICLIDSDSARVTMAAGSKGAFILIYDGKKDGKWSDPIFVAERTYDAVTSSDQPPNANNDNDNNSSGGEGCIAGGVAGASVAAALLGLMLRKKR
ncbi:MAG: hypothetical protein LBU13_02140, partial [Synergistaceae bacterium]|nr:hypothetical protein [Synergistaceae bacterium]